MLRWQLHLTITRGEHGTSLGGKTNCDLCVSARSSIQRWGRELGRATIRRVKCGVFWLDNKEQTRLWTFHLRTVPPAEVQYQSCSPWARCLHIVLLGKSVASPLMTCLSTYLPTLLLYRCVSRHVGASPDNCNLEFPKAGLDRQGSHQPWSPPWLHRLTQQMVFSRPN